MKPGCAIDDFFAAQADSQGAKCDSRAGSRNFVCEARVKKIPPLARNTLTVTSLRGTYFWRYYDKINKDCLTQLSQKT